MRLPKGPHCLLSGRHGAAFTEGPTGRFAPVRLAQTHAARGTRLDCFDQPLRRSGRLLLDLGTELVLFLPNGKAVSQPVLHVEHVITDLPDGAVKQALSDLSPLRNLLPCGSVTLDRVTLALVDDEHKTRCRAALHILTSPEGTDVTLVDLSGLRGYHKARIEVLGHLKSSGGSAFKMENLYHHLFPHQTIPDTRPKVALTQGQSAYDAAMQIIARYIPVARLNEPGIIGDFDSEFLHDYRIALRKIRSVLSLFKWVYAPAQTAELKARFAALMAQTGALRDLDVHLLQQRATFDMVLPSLHVGLDAMFALRRAERAAVQTKLARHLSSTRYVQIMADLTEIFATPARLEHGPQAARAVHDLATTLIWKRYQKARVIAGHITAETPDAQLHALRIHCKKLRYLMEFASTLYPAPALRPAIKTIKHLQDNLGTANDLAVQLCNLQTFLNGADAWKDSEKLAIAQSVGALMTVLHQRKLAKRHHTEPLVAAFASHETQEIFRDLFHPRKPKP